MSISLGYGYRKDGSTYIPQYITAVNHEDCIGCGRCYKVCAADVFDLKERSDLGLEDDDYEDEGAMVMTIKSDGNCVGCMACSRVCTKGCHSFKPLAA